MTHCSRQVLAFLLITWLPLFFGNAQAASILMQFKVGDCHSEQVVSSQAQYTQHVSTIHHQHEDHLVQQDHQQVQKQEKSMDCGICFVACCGYMAASVVEVAESNLPALKFLPASTQFQSATSVPLDPPPLARV